MTSAGARQVTRSPGESPRSDEERMGHAMAIVAEGYGEAAAAWLSVRWCRVLSLLGRGDPSAAMAALWRHVRSVGDEADLVAMSQIDEAVSARVLGACGARRAGPVRRVPFGGGDPSKRRGAFVAITARSRIYEGYDDPSMGDDQRAALHPMCLMVMRWDGNVGFVGGLTEGRPPLEQLCVEMAEECGFEPRDVGGMEPIVSHEADSIVVDLWRYDLGVVPKSVLHSILARAASAESAKHAIVEGCAFWAHLADYGGGRGVGALRGAWNLSTAVGEEIDAVLDSMSRDGDRA